MRSIYLWAAIACSTLISACQTTNNLVDDFLHEMGIMEKPFNPDEVTITIMELRGTLPNYVTNLKTLQQGQLAIRNLQIKLEQIDKQVKNSNNVRAKRSLMGNFSKTFNQRVLLQDKASEVLNQIHRSISKAKKKRKKVMKIVNRAIPKYSSRSDMRSKLREQKAALETIGKHLTNVYIAAVNTEKNFEAMFDYTLQYDNNHPRIYGQAYAVEKR